jgi:23S rRNA (uracil1939-C5)-methyltransferase
VNKSDSPYSREEYTQVSHRKNKAKIKPHRLKKKSERPHKQIDTSGVLSLPFGASGPCERLSVCGACPLLPLSYEAQLEWKVQDLHTQLHRYEVLKELKVEYTPSQDSQAHYRHTAKPSVRRDQLDQNSLKIGLYQPRSHSLIDLDDCLAQTPMINQLLDDLRRLCPDVGIVGYEHGDELKTDQVCRLRYVVIRQGESSTSNPHPPTSDEQAAVDLTPALHLTLIMTFIDFDLVDKLIRLLAHHNPALSGVGVHLNRLKGNAIFDFSSPSHHHWGEASLLTTLRLSQHMPPLVLQISATSFAQVNPHVAQRAYRHVVSALNPQANELGLDLYCGVGAIGLLMAQNARKRGEPLKRLWGLEETESSISDARYNAKSNGIDEAEFIVGRAEDTLTQLVDRVLCYDQPSIVVALNPSRRGCQAEVLRLITQLQPRAIAYMSCHARTLTRDLSLLFSLGYSADHITLFDMFPGSYHYETVTVLSKR